MVLRLEKGDLEQGQGPARSQRRRLELFAGFGSLLGYNGLGACLSWNDLVCLFPSRARAEVCVECRGMGLARLSDVGCEWIVAGTLMESSTGLDRFLRAGLRCARD